MKDAVVFTENEHRLTIEISPSVKPVVRFGLIFQGVLLILTAVFMTYSVIAMIADIPAAVLWLMILCVVYAIAGKKYLNRVLYKETIDVTRDELTIVDSYFLSKTINIFPVSEITELNFAGQPGYTKHPMDTGTVDITGLGMTEKQLQYIIDDGTIELFHHGSIRRFGKGLASWDAEKILDRIQAFIGNTFPLNNTEILLKEPEE